MAICVKIPKKAYRRKQTDSSTRGYWDHRLVKHWDTNRFLSLFKVVTASRKLLRKQRSSLAVLLKTNAPGCDDLARSHGSPWPIES